LFFKKKILNPNQLKTILKPSRLNLKALKGFKRA